MLAKIQRNIKKRQDLERNLKRSEEKLAELKQQELELYRKDGDEDDSIFGRKFKGIDAQICKEDDLVKKYRKAIQGRKAVIDEAIEKHRDETQKKIKADSSNLVLEHKTSWNAYRDLLKQTKQKGMVVDNLKIKSQLATQAAVKFTERKWTTSKLLDIFENSNFTELNEATAEALGLINEYQQYRSGLKTQVEKETRKGKEIKRLEVKKRKELRGICDEWVRRKWIPAEIATSRGIDSAVLFGWFLKTENHPSQYDTKVESPIKKKLTQAVI